MDEALLSFASQRSARKGTIERRLNRWGFSARRVLVLLTNHNDQTDDFKQRIKELKQAGIEVLVVNAADNEVKLVLM